MKTLFTAIALLLAVTASASAADTTCTVNAPDGELNVRELTANGPGKVTDVLKNGYTVWIGRSPHSFRSRARRPTADTTTGAPIAMEGLRHRVASRGDEDRVHLPQLFGLNAHVGDADFLIVTT
jgi:hypothetical protein